MKYLVSLKDGELPRSQCDIRTTLIRNIIIIIPANTIDAQTQQVFYRTVCVVSIDTMEAIRMYSLNKTF